MGGAILSIKASSEEELNMKVDKIIQKAGQKGLSDLRGVKVFTPGTYEKPNGKPEDQWVAVLWVHS